jgi:hypothetical protein
MGKKKNSTAPAPKAPTPGIVVLTTSDEAVEHERVPIFEIDGVTYSVERKPRVGVSLGYLRRLGTDGSDAAIGYLLENMIGTAGMKALEEYEELTKEQLQDVIARVKHYAMGGLEDPKGS